MREDVTAAGRARRGGGCCLVYQRSDALTKKHAGSARARARAEGASGLRAAGQRVRMLRRHLAVCRIRVHSRRARLLARACGAQRNGAQPRAGLARAHVPVGRERERHQAPRACAIRKGRVGGVGAGARGPCGAIAAARMPKRPQLVAAGKREGGTPALLSLHAPLSSHTVTEGMRGSTRVLSCRGIALCLVRTARGAHDRECQLQTHPAARRCHVPRHPRGHLLPPGGPGRG